jgi:hypothetical protein
MYSDEALLKAYEKIDGDIGIAHALEEIHENLRNIFNTVLPSELNHDEIMALVEQRLDGIYTDFAEHMNA